MKSKNTLLEGFALKTSQSELTQLNDNTSVNKGKIIAFDIMGGLPPNIIDTNTPFVSLDVGGVGIIEDVVYTDFMQLGNNSDYKLYPLQVNDGQTFQLQVDAEGVNISDDEFFRSSVVFIREGFRNEYKRNFNLSPNKVSFKEVTSVFNTDTEEFKIISGIIPRHKGNCIGFKILSNSLDQGGVSNGNVTFNINGIEVLKNVDSLYFSTICTRKLNEIYPIGGIEAGSTFELTVKTDIDNTDVYTVQFLFEDTDNTYSM